MMHRTGSDSACTCMQAARAAALEEVEQIVARCANGSSQGRAIVLVDDNAWLRSMRKTIALIAKRCVLQLKIWISPAVHKSLDGGQDCSCGSWL
jgi:hypothetical protein